MVLLISVGCFLSLIGSDLLDLIDPEARMESLTFANQQPFPSRCCRRGRQISGCGSPGAAEAVSRHEIVVSCWQRQQH